MRRHLEQHARDTVPQERVRRLGRVVQETRNDELFVGAEVPQDARGLRGMAIVGASRTDVARGLLHAMQHR